MGLARKNPLSVRVLGRIPVDEDRVSDLISEISTADEARAEWLNKQYALTRQRYGIREGKAAGPWPGSSDLRIPTQDKAIRRWKPKILSLVFDSQPIAYFRALEPGDVESAQAVEHFYDWLFRIHMEESLEECCYLADLIAHRGFGFLQISWDYRTEDETRLVELRDLVSEDQEISDEDLAELLRAQYDLDPEEIDPEMLAALRRGERVTLKFQTVVADRPRITARDPVQVVAPPRATSVADAPWICVQHVFDARTLQAMGRDERFDEAAVARVLEHVQGDKADGQAGRERQAPAPLGPDEEALLDRHEGLSVVEDLFNIEVWEIYTWVDAPERRRAVYWIHPASQTVLAAHPYVLPFHGWPLVRFDFEKTYRRWYGSRGISNMLSPLARAINKLHNARLDAIAIQLAPVFKWVAPAGVPPRSIRFAPGQFIPVSDLGDIAPLTNDLRNIPMYTQEEYQTRQYAEDYAGIYDSSLMNALNPTERRTATEVNYVAEQMQGSFSLDAKLFQQAMAEVHRMVWQLWYEFGRPEVYYRVMNEEAPRLFRKLDAAFNYDVVPVGTPANTNKAIELARAREALQLLAADQSGVIDRAELFKWYLSRLDYLLSKRVIRGTQEQQAAQVLLAAANEIQSGSLQQILGEAAAARQALASGSATPNAPPGL